MSLQLRRERTFVRTETMDKTMYYVVAIPHQLPPFVATLTVKELEEIAASTHGASYTVVPLAEIDEFCKANGIDQSDVKWGISSKKRHASLIGKNLAYVCYPNEEPFLPYDEQTEYDAYLQYIYGHDYASCQFFKSQDEAETYIARYAKAKRHQYIKVGALKF